MAVELKDFEIEFIKFKDGIHTLSFQLCSDFFQLFEKSSLDSGNLNATVIFEKKTQLLDFDMKVMGNVGLFCDRCLTKNNYPIEGKLNLHVKITENIGEEEEDLTYILPSEHSFNIAGYLYEIINLAIPMRKTCEDIGEKCDESVLEKLNKIAVDKEGDENKEQNPEWDKLKDILNNLK
ncbi:MAG: DUF177 domain-containing protein [Bacteroidetes bacterium]|nr:DUF177 domain-containing protein [Bacteroidota bacterium]